MASWLERRGFPPIHKETIMKRTRLLLLSALVFLLTTNAFSQTEIGFTRVEDVIYGRKYGVALTMDVLRPEKPNGYGIIYVVSGGWYSAKSAIRPLGYSTFLTRGYTLFAVVHGSQPKFQIPEIEKDMHRAVRYIRHHAKEYGIDPDKLGVTGGSAGGHLSLMLATRGAVGNAKAEDPVERESSAVQAVACFFPPTDFLNYGKEGEDAVGVGILRNYSAAFGRMIGTEKGRQMLGRAISPVNFVSDKTPPVLIVHGDADTLVPIQQAEIFVKKCEENGVQSKLVSREGKGHGWPEMGDDMPVLADWFDRYLRGAASDSK